MKVMFVILLAMGSTSCATMFPSYKPARNCQKVETWLCDQYGTYCQRAVRTECIEPVKNTHDPYWRRR